MLIHFSNFMFIHFLNFMIVHFLNFMLIHFLNEVLQRTLAYLTINSGICFKRFFMQSTDTFFMSYMHTELSLSKYPYPLNITIVAFSQKSYRSFSRPSNNNKNQIVRSVKNCKTVRTSVKDLTGAFFSGVPFLGKTMNICKDPLRSGVAC